MVLPLVQLLSHDHGLMMFDTELKVALDSLFVLFHLVHTVRGQWNGHGCFVNLLDDGWSPEALSRLATLGQFVGRR